MALEEPYEGVHCQCALLSRPRVKSKNGVKFNRMEAHEPATDMWLQHLDGLVCGAVQPAKRQDGVHLAIDDDLEEHIGDEAEGKGFPPRR